MSGSDGTGITRRDFSVLAAGGVAATAMMSPAFAEPADAMLRSKGQSAVDLVLVDDRFSDAAAFADAARAAGVMALPTRGDLGALWFGGLRDDLGTVVRRVAGMGRHSDFWIMQQLAADKGMTLRFYAEHDFRGRTALTHRLPETANDLREKMTAEAGHWATHVAQHVTASTADHAPKPLIDVASARPAADDHPGLLVSWVFA